MKKASKPNLKNNRYLCPQMKLLAVILFSSLLLTQTFSKWLLIADYTINKEYIAKNLCENRSKPKLHCNGKCQLMKKMAAEEDEANKNTSGNSLSKMSFSETLFNDEPVEKTLLAPAAQEPVFNGFYLVKKYSSLPSSIFHPPLV